MSYSDIYPAAPDGIPLLKTIVASSGFFPNYPIRRKQCRCRLRVQTNKCSSDPPDTTRWGDQQWSRQLEEGAFHQGSSVQSDSEEGGNCTQYICNFSQGGGKYQEEDHFPEEGNLQAGRAQTMGHCCKHHCIDEGMIDISSMSHHI